MNRIIENYIYNIIYQLFVTAVPIVLSPYLARVLGAEKIGIYSYINSVASLVSTIALLGTYNYGCRQIAYIRDDKVRVNEMYYQIFTFRCILGIVCTILYFVIAVTSKYPTYFFIYYTWILASFIDPSWLFVGEEDMRPTVVKNFFIKVGSVLLIFLFVKQETDLWKYVCILGLSTLIANSILIIQTRKYVGRFVLKFSGWNEIVRGSLYLFWPQATTMVYLQFNKIMLNFITEDTKQVSFYDYTEKLVTIPLTFITVLSTVMMPRIANDYAKGEGQKMRESLVLAGQFSLMLAIPLSLGIASIAEKLIPWYLGKEFIPTIYGIIFMSPIIILNSLAGISGSQYFTATNQINILLKSYISAAIINVLANIVLIPKYGFVGSAISIVIASMISIGIQYWYMNKQIKVGEFWFYGLKYLLSALPMIAGVFLLGSIMPANPLTTFVQIIIGAFLYLAILLLSRDKILFKIISKSKAIIKRK
ncbi:flippase [Priestia megaterium]|uniref:flippase n=1 Tax=Priestia megaterium TaxID=1404 RepID=UPI003241BCB3